MGENLISTVTIPLSEYERLRYAANKKTVSVYIHSLTDYGDGRSVSYSGLESEDVNLLENISDTMNYELKKDNTRMAIDLAAIKSKWWYKLFSKL